MRINQIAVSLALSFAISAPLYAAVSVDEAAKLGGDKVNSVGAERAGNADGTIPAWVAGWKGPQMPVEGGIYPDPFGNEKAQYSITAANLAQHADKLTPGTQELLKRWPDFRVDVYQSHRVVDFPDWLKKASIANATRAKSTDDGADMGEVMGGYPYPIPKTGAEVMWNHNLRYYGPSYRTRFKGYLVDATGNLIMTHDLENYTESPYHETPDKAAEHFQRRMTVTHGPARVVGDKALTYMNLNFEKDGPNKIWSYTQGQRRVRLAPDFAYDTPMHGTGGSYFYDELGMWEGQLDRFDFKLAGKKEVLVPYNNYKFLLHTEAEKAYGKQFANPDLMRWEMHRVWVVEATLKNGKRHAQSKKVFYLDEDSWSIVLYEGYDQAGKMMRAGQGFFVYDWNTQSVPNTPMVMYDLIKGQYVIPMHMAGGSGFVRVPRWPNSRLTPDAMAGGGIR